MLCSPRDRAISRRLKVDMALTRAVWRLYPPCATDPALFVARDGRRWAVVQKHKALNVGDALASLVQQSEQDQQQATAVGARWGLKPSPILPPSPAASIMLKNINLGRVGSVPETVWKIVFYLDTEDGQGAPTAFSIASKIRASDNRVSKLPWSTESDEILGHQVNAVSRSADERMLDVLTMQGRARHRDAQRPRAGQGPHHGSRYIGGVGR